MNFNETQQSEMLPYELPTALANYGSQNLGAVGGQPMQDASMDQNQTFDAIQMLEEDFDQYDHYGNEVVPDQVDEYSDMLRDVLLGDGLSSQEPDM